MRNRNYLKVVIQALALSCALLGLGCEQMKTQEPFKKFENDAAVPRISVADAKKEVDAGSAVIVDSRAESAYKQERIAGSINVTNEKEFDRLTKGKKIIVYCS